MKMVTSFDIIRCDRCDRFIGGTQERTYWELTIVVYEIDGSEQMGRRPIDLCASCAESMAQSLELLSTLAPVSFKPNFEERNLPDWDRQWNFADRFRREL